MRRRVTSNVVASPVLVGAVTVLITIVAVFLSYNANQGLPFVPTYELKAELPSGAALVSGNAVRVGGKRVGQVGEIRTKTVEREGEPLTLAEIELTLDKEIEPLAADTLVVVRPVSALGLKYVDLAPGRSRQTLQPGSTIPLANARATVELEDVLSTFDPETRVASRASLEGYGDAFAGRGPAINDAIGALRPLVVHLEPVMRTLSDPDTELDELIPQLARTVAQVAPVADVQAQLFTNMADTFDAFSRNPAALQQTIEKSPGTLEAAISSFRVQQPFLAQFTALSRELQPASAELRRALPSLNSALDRGEPVLLATPRTSRLTSDVLRELEDLGQNPNTLLGLRDLRRLIETGAPLLSFVAPYQTVCNYFNYFFTPLGEHLSEEVPGGTIERIQVILADPEQDNGLGTSDADRFADVPAGQDPKTYEGGDVTKLNTQYYAPAIDADGNADCENGQHGYPAGPLITTGRYPPSTDPAKGGGSHVVLDPNLPVLTGGTYKARELGIDNLKDVP